MKPPKMNVKNTNDAVDLPDDPVPALDTAPTENTKVPTPAINFPLGMKILDGGLSKDEEIAAKPVEAMDDQEIDPTMAELVSAFNDFAADAGLTEPVAAAVKKPSFKINMNGALNPKTDMPDTGGVDDLIQNHAKQIEKEDKSPPVMPISGGSGFSIHFGGRNHKEVANKVSSALSANEEAIKQKAKDDTGLQSKLKRIGELASKLGDMIPTEEIANKFKEIAEMISKMVEALINKMTGSRAP